MNLMTILSLAGRRKGKRKKVDLLLSEVASLRDSVSKMMTLSADSQIPLGLKRIIHNTFKRHICHVAPIRPPVIFSKCCKTVLGCESCLNTRYSGPDALVKTCPVCRAERGYNETMLVRGLDEFLIEIGKVFRVEDVHNQGATSD